MNGRPTIISSDMIAPAMRPNFKTVRFICVRQDEVGGRIGLPARFVVMLSGDFRLPAPESPVRMTKNGPSANQAALLPELNGLCATPGAELVEQPARVGL